MLIEVKYIPIERMLCISANIPEGIPIHLVEFEYANGIEGSFCIGYDSRSNGNGVAMVDLGFKKNNKFKDILFSKLYFNLSRIREM